MLHNVVLFDLLASSSATPDDATPDATAEATADATPDAAADAAVDRAPRYTLAAELRWIREISTLGFVTFLPSAPSPVCGVVQLRGAIVPVVDLAGLLGLPATLPHQGDPALIVEIDQAVAAFRIDARAHVATLPASELGEPPRGLRLLAGVSAAGVRTTSGAVVPLLDLPALLHHCAQLISAAAQASDLSPRGHG